MTIGFLPPIGVLAPLMTTSQSFTMAGCLAIGLRSVFPAARLYYRHQHSSQLGGDTMKRFWSAVCVAILVVCLAAVAAPAAHASVHDGTQGWFWQTPQPAGDLNDVTFAGPSDVWAVGSGGEILHSTDAGVTWSAQQSGTLADLASVSFADTQHGWACGPSAVVTTSDGGSTWSSWHTGGAEPLPDERLLRR